MDIQAGIRRKKNLKCALLKTKHVPDLFPFSGNEKQIILLQKQHYTPFPAVMIIKKNIFTPTEGVCAGGWVAVL